MSVVGLSGPGYGGHQHGHYSQVCGNNPVGQLNMLTFFHVSQVMLNDDSSGSSSDKIGPYKTTTNISNRWEST